VADRPAVVGGLTWERRPIDPLPGPRRLDELVEATPLHAAVALAGPRTTGPGGFSFAESRMSAVLGAPTVLVDPTGGPRPVAEGLSHAAAHLGCDVIVLLDVGGDALAHGDEPGLASPLADAILIAAAPLIATATVVGAVFGAGCDGELTPEEVLERLDEVGAVDLGVPSDATLERLEAAVAAVPTEASAMAVRCARGETGRALIRGGRRSVQLTPTGGHLWLFDPAAALAGPARCAAAVRDARDLAEADAILTALGIRTELAYEREAAA
jgi:hypothetical protein